MIDAHQHFWRLGRHDCQWPTPELSSIYRDFMPVDLAPELAASGVEGTVLVQSQTSDADTDFLLALASDQTTIKAVVGWVDLAAPTAAERIASLARHPKLRGLRPMLQAMPEDDWLLRPELEPALAAMKAANLSLDALVFPRHLPHLLRFARRHPDLPIVIDHAAKPDIARAELEPWASSMCALADLPQVYCKLSGLLNQAGAEQGYQQLQPYVAKLYHWFGAKRLLWGSDWPVLLAAPNPHYASYSAWLSLAKALLPGLSPAEERAIFGENARYFYRC